ATTGPDQAAEAARVRVPPPAPMPLQPVGFPPFRESTLPNGLRMIVVEKRDLPVANVSLYIQSGSATDPGAKLGLAEMTAQLLTKGTPRRNALQISETIESVGGSLNASAGLDNMSVSASVLTDQLPLAFDLLSDVALRPTFPADELEIARKRTLTGLQVALSQPGQIAQRRLIQEIYGDESPYGRSTVPQTVSALQRADLTRFHQENFKADNALLVVSGDVSAAQVEQLARQHFGAMPRGFSARAPLADPPARGPARVTLIHRPGSVQSNILVGHVGIRPDNPDFFPLQVLNKIVGGGTDSRLFLILREQKGWTYGAYSMLSRPRNVGYYLASAEVRSEVTDSALVELMSQLGRVREEAVSPAELEAAKSFLAGSFPLRIETASQIASQVAQNRLLGLPTEALIQYRDRINAVTAQDVQRVARQYVRPDQAAIIVVGDATKVAESLRRVAPVALFDIQGKPMESASLEVRASSERFDASRLRPVTLTYRVMVQGNPFGTATSSLSQQGGQWVGTSNVQLGPVTQQSETRFTNQMVPVSTRQSSAGPVQTQVELQFANGRVTGTAKLPPQAGGDKTFNTEVVGGTLLPGMDEYVLAVADLQPGRTLTLPVFSAQTGAVVNHTVRVTGTESVTVPAGTFQTYRLESTGGQQSFTVFVRQELPHIVVKQEFVGQPVALELQAIK
ncbi:MAG: insulinase family protein, partial [Gemmatimonadota bacterium]|nr:insulinase family protein [Gemmatimonadota bacterium]